MVIFTIGAAATLAALNQKGNIVTEFNNITNIIFTIVNYVDKFIKVQNKLPSQKIEQLIYINNVTVDVELVITIPDSITVYATINIIIGIVTRPSIIRF